ncbi:MULTISPECIES: hypothetical protein [unclassified Lysinibacillus]|uniref:hypothetical protein n=1 Tax=unclassified Lysinibacillus TaxID=2636778 RepID=UPI003830E238
MSKTVTVDFLYKNELFDYLQLRINIPSAMKSLNMMNIIPIQVTGIPLVEQLACFKVSFGIS